MPYMFVYSVLYLPAESEHCWTLFEPVHLNREPFNLHNLCGSLYAVCSFLLHFMLSGFNI